MKKTILLIFFGIVIALLTIGLSGCMEENNEEISDSERFIGTWTQEAAELWYEISEIEEITFYENNTFSTDANLSGEYEIKNEKLVLTFNDGGQELSFDYQFFDENKRLTLIDSGGNTAAYSKQ